MPVSKFSHEFHWGYIQELLEQQLDIKEVAALLRVSASRLSLVYQAEHDGKLLRDFKKECHAACKGSVRRRAYNRGMDLSASHQDFKYLADRVLGPVRQLVEQDIKMSVDVMKEMEEREKADWDDTVDDKV